MNLQSGYVEMNILGQKRGLKFGNLAFERIEKELFKLYEGAEYYNTKMQADIVFAGLINNCYRKGVDPDFTYEQIFDFIDDNQRNIEVVTEIAEVIRVYENSKPMQEHIERVKEAIDTIQKEQDSKKKVAGKKSKSSV